MDLELFKLGMAAIAGAVTSSGPIIIAVIRSRAKTAAQIQATAQKMSEEFQNRLQSMADKEHARRVEAENKMLQEARSCDQRIEGVRLESEKRVDALRGRNDQLYDMQIKLMDEKAALRIEVHDLRGEVAAWRKSMKKGGKRHTDPPADP